jgi:hypothetical protein
MTRFTKNSKQSTTKESTAKATNIQHQKNTPQHRKVTKTISPNHNTNLYNTFTTYNKPEQSSSQEIKQKKRERNEVQLSMLSSRYQQEL